MQIELTYKGDSVEGHSHKFDHQHLLSVGEVEITVDGVATTYKAPTILFIKKGKCHKMKALSDYSLGYCIHPIRDGDRVQDILDPSTVPEGVRNIEDESPFSMLTEDYKSTFDSNFSSK